MLGLIESDLEYIIECIKDFEEINKATVFGSRAKGNYKIGSDIDICIYGEKITFTVISKLHSMLEEVGPLPYMVDIVNYEELKNDKIIEHIDRVGVVIFKRV
ncbi:MAG: nucleotidyltransferase domain-containing protein [Clostridium sp.]